MTYLFLVDFVCITFYMCESVAKRCVSIDVLFHYISRYSKRVFILECAHPLSRFKLPISFTMPGYHSLPRERYSHCHGLVLSVSVFGFSITILGKEA